MPFESVYGKPLEYFQHSSIISFASGKTKDVSTLLTILKYSGKTLLIFDKTPFHPIDYMWPDQPSDTGKIIFPSQKEIVISVNSCYILAFNMNNEEEKIANEIKNIKKKDKRNWIYLVVHEINTMLQVDVLDQIGQVAQLEVDEVKRIKLSAAHTACHVASLALNSVLSSSLSINTPGADSKEITFWKKKPKKDSLENSDFDKQFIIESIIKKNGSINRYSFGRNAKKLISHDLLLQYIDKIRDGVNNKLQLWLKDDSSVVIEPSEAEIDQERVWKCTLGGKPAVIPCGGTHISQLSFFSNINVNFKLNINKKEKILEMDTKFSLNQA